MDNDQNFIEIKITLEYTIILLNIKKISFYYYINK